MNAKSNKKWHYIAVSAIALLLIFMSAIFCRGELEKTKIQASLTLESFKEIITLNLKKKLNYTYLLTADLMAQGSSDHFDEAAAQIMENPGCVFVEVLQGTTLTKIYPPDSEQQKDKGADIAKLNYAYTLARLTKGLIVEGPIKQGDQEIFLFIQPIFVKDDNGKNIFAGEAVVALDSSYVMETLNLESLTKSGYEYELWRIHPLDGRKEKISISSEKVDFSKAMEIKFEMPTVWTLSIIPVEGWYNKELIFAIAFNLIIVVISVLCVLSFYRSKKELEHAARISGKYDKETGLLNRQPFMEELKIWGLNHKEPFMLIYVVLENYNIISQLSTREQDLLFLVHISTVFKKYIKNRHITARLGENNFVVAIKDESGLYELENMQKGMSIELIQKFEYDGENIFITAESEYCIFPRDGVDTEKLLEMIVRNHFLKQNRQEGIVTKL